jgi:DNA-binding CsgD family transcriptional regulator
VCIESFEWTRDAIASYDADARGADQLHGLMASTLDLVLAVAPASGAAYALLDELPGRLSMGPCLVRADDGVARAESFLAVVSDDPLLKLAVNDGDGFLQSTEHPAVAEPAKPSRAVELLASYGVGPRLTLCLRNAGRIVGIVMLCRTQSEPEFSQLEKQQLFDTRGLLETVHRVAIAQARADAQLSILTDDLELSDRQREIVRLVCAGHSNTAIAQRLGISASEVRGDLGHVYRHLGIQRRQQLQQLVRGLPDHGQPPSAGALPA